MPLYIGVATFIYTNGKHLIYQDDIGYVYCKNADGTDKARKILDFHIYKTKNSFTTMIPYENKIFYSTYSGYTAHYKIYSVNITGKANKKTISKSYNLEFPSTQVLNRYFYVSNKKNQAAVKASGSGSAKKLAAVSRKGYTLDSIQKSPPPAPITPIRPTISSISKPKASKKHPYLLALREQKRCILVIII